MMREAVPRRQLKRALGRALGEEGEEGGGWYGDPAGRRRNCSRPGSSSPPGSAAASTPHSRAMVARAVGPM